MCHSGAAPCGGVLANDARVVTHLLIRACIADGMPPCMESWQNDWSNSEHGVLAEDRPDSKPCGADWMGHRYPVVNLDTV